MAFAPSGLFVANTGNALQAGIDRGRDNRKRNALSDIAGALNKNDYEAAGVYAANSGDPDLVIKIKELKAQGRQQEIDTIKAQTEATREFLAIGEQLYTQNPQAFQQAAPALAQQFVQANPWATYEDAMQELMDPAQRQASYARAQGISGMIDQANTEFEQAMKVEELNLKRGELAVKQGNLRLAQNKGPDPKLFENEQKLRKEFTGITSDYRNVVQNFQSIESVGGMKTSAGDLALIVAFTKLLDPGSVAREGEVQLTQSAASAVAKAGNLVNTWVKGKTILPDEVREQYLKASKELMQSYQKSFDKRTEEYSAIAARHFPDTPVEQIIVGGSGVLSGVQGVQEAVASGQGKSLTDMTSDEASIAASGPFPNMSDAEIDAAIAEAEKGLR